MRNMSALGHVFLFRMNEPPEDPRLWSASKPQSLLMPFLTATTKNHSLAWVFLLFPSQYSWVSTEF